MSPQPTWRPSSAGNRSRTRASLKPSDSDSDNYLVESLRQSAAMELFLLPTATACLALHGLGLLVSGFGHLIRQGMSQAPIETVDLVLAVTLVLVSAPIIAACRIVNRREYGSLTPPAHLILFLSTLIESVIAVVFFWTIVSNPTNAVSDFILGFVATSGLVTSAVLVISTELISKRA